MADILHKDTYNIHLPVFDGPFDLLLFFIERDELDIQNIPIAKITGDFLDYIRSMEEINIDLAGEFIVTAATLMRIKARMLLPLKKNEESFKEVSEELSRLETERAMLHTRGGILSDIKRIQHASVSYNELESANLYNLIRTFNRLLARMNDPDKSNVHQIVDYPYTIQDCREDILNAVRNNEKCSFDTLFSGCENRIHAIVQFLSLLELINQQLFKIVNASGANAFWISEKKTEERDSSDEAN